MHTFSLADELPVMKMNLKIILRSLRTRKCALLVKHHFLVSIHSILYREASVNEEEVFTLAFQILRKLFNTFEDEVPALVLFYFDDFQKNWEMMYLCHNDTKSREVIFKILVTHINRCKPNIPPIEQKFIKNIEDLLALKNKYGNLEYNNLLDELALLLKITIPSDGG